MTTMMPDEEGYGWVNAKPITQTSDPVDKFVYTAPDGTKFTDQVAYATYMAAYYANKNAADAAAEREAARKAAEAKAIADKKAADDAAAAAAKKAADDAAAAAAKKAADDAAAVAAKKAERDSAWTVLSEQFSRYGLGELVGAMKDIIMSGGSDNPTEMLLRLRETDAYKKRFAANEARIKNGFKAIDEATYLDLEDAYADLMRKYGLPAWYTEQGVNGRQQGLETFIANNISPVQLEDRIQLAVNRVQNGPKEVLDALKKFYPDITNGDVLAYVLDPKKALPVLQRRVTAAEIGGEALRYGLDTSLNRADELAGLGIDQKAARKGYGQIGEGLERGRQLGGIYGENYDQNTAEQEVFGMNDAAAASRKRRKITNLEQATFGGSTGIKGGALEQNRAGGF